MSRPTQGKLVDNLRDIEQCLEHKRARFPFKLANEIGMELRHAQSNAHEIEKFGYSAMSVEA